MNFNNFSQNSKAPMSEINTTPLVDVMLVLLVIFIITAPLITNTVKIDLPTTKSKSVIDKPKIVNISINEKGIIFWNSKEVKISDLKNLMNNEKSDKSDTEIHIRADRSTRYEIITSIMTEAQNSGITKLGFVSKVEK